MKNDLRIQILGEIDELNSVIGLALSSNLSHKLESFLKEIQNQLLNLGAELCYRIRPKFITPKIEKENIINLEEFIDKINKLVGPLENFILPGGSLSAAYLHFARTICRRAERLLVTLREKESIGDNVIPYVNRLSDALFVAARLENKEKNIAELLWHH